MSKCIYNPDSSISSGSSESDMSSFISGSSRSSGSSHSSKSSNYTDLASVSSSLNDNSSSNNYLATPLINKVVIDVAVLSQEFANMDVICGDHIINLDEIPITTELFQSIFYPYLDNFGLNVDYICNNKHLLPYVSFLPEFRSINTKNFFLLEELISNIENDLNVSRMCFTRESLVEMTNEISRIKTLCNINGCSLVSSLTWSNILGIIQNYKLLKNKNDDNIIPILVVNIIFKTPTPGVKKTLIRFQYKITN